MAALVNESLQRLACAVEQTSLRINQCQVNVYEYVCVFHESVMWPNIIVSHVFVAYHFLWLPILIPFFSHVECFFV